jgi:2-oxoglutarate/2-oxoacid ferredoxin oxidoreductase subunit beta
MPPALALIVGCRDPSVLLSLPLSAAPLEAEATLVARSIDSDRAHLTEVLAKAAAHKGTAFVEIYQNWNIFNDGAFDLLKEPDTRTARLGACSPHFAT